MNMQKTSSYLASLTNHSRRTFLGFAATAAAGLTASLYPSAVHASTTDASERGVAPEIEGTWLDTVTLTTPDLPPPYDKPFPTLITYARGGGLVTIAGNTAPTRGNMSFGTWAKIGPHQYTFTFMGFFYDAQGALERWVKAHATTIRVEPGGKNYSGEGWVQQLDMQFNVLGQVSFISHATRINAQ